MKRALVFLASVVSCVVLTSTGIRSQTCDPVTLPNGTVVAAGAMQYDGQCIVVPPGAYVTIDGLHYFRSVVVQGSVTHSAGSAGIHWVVEEDVTISGSIDVTGKGLAGANKDGSGRPVEAVDPASSCNALVIIEGAGFLAGGTHGGGGGVCDSDVCFGEVSNAVYGSLERPCFPGSGGGACIDGRGGDGGGVVMIEARNITLSGYITADGTAAPNYGGAGGGSGGSIYLEARNVGGNGGLRARGGTGAFSYGGGGGGGGRIAIAVEVGISLREYGLDASGGQGIRECPAGQVGTVWIQVGDAAPTVILGYCGGMGQATPPIPDTDAIGRLVLRGPVRMTEADFEALTARPDVLEVLCASQLRVNGLLDLDPTELLLDRGEIVVGPEGHLTIARFDETVAKQGTLQLEGSLEVLGTELTIPPSVQMVQIGKGMKLLGDGGLLDDLTIAAGATVTHAPGAGNEVYLEVTNRIDVRGGINVTGKGLFGENRQGSGHPPEAVDPASTCDQLIVVDGSGELAGGSHGGLGGVCDKVCAGGVPNAPYGSLQAACFPGSGGGACIDGRGGDGGGVVRLQARTIVVSGVVYADGAGAENYSEGAGGGSGGSIQLSAVSVTGNGRLQAQGGGGAFSYGGGGGGGGRIVVEVQAGSGLTENQLDASGGPGYQDCPPGQVGTVWIEVAGEAPTLLVGSCGGQGQPDLPPIPEIDSIGRLVVRGPIRLSGADFEEVTPRPESLEVRCAAQLRVEQPLEILDTSLYLDQGEILVGPEGMLTLPTFDETVAASGTLRLEGPLAVNSPTMTIPRSVTVEQIGLGLRLLGAPLVERLTIASAAMLTHAPGAGNELRLEANQRIEILGAIDVSGKGLPGANPGGVSGLAKAVDPASTCGAIAVIDGAGDLAGGSHAGLGGTCRNQVCLAGNPNPVYGSAEVPCLPGSGGGACIDGRGGAGGGVVRVETGAIVLNGYIYADGRSAENYADGGGGGSGGAIYLAARTVSGNGSLRAWGGDGSWSYGGGGGSGGRIGIDYIEGMSLRENAITAAGGVGRLDCPGGAEGTVSIRDVEEPLEDAFHRGDPNDDGNSDISDAAGLLNYLFANSAEPQCLDAGDINDDGQLNITDPISLLNWLFGDGAPPAAPGPPGFDACGLDPDGSVSLGCEEYTHC